MSDVQLRLNLTKPPVAVAFLNAPPAGVRAWSGGPVPAGCVFWKKAQEGLTFYTTPSDHYNCAVGAHTHHIALPVERAKELEQTVGFMVGNDYLSMTEVPGIPTLPTSPAIVAYAPADGAPFTPSVVIVAANPAQAMLVYEASLKLEGGAALVNTLGRPGCAALPLALQNGGATISLGCKGNRTFTGLPEDEMYVVIPGEKWPALAEHIVKICEANQAMRDYYRLRQAQFSA